MKRTRSLLTWGALAMIAASANAFAAKNAASLISPLPNFDVGSIIGDAMSPVNPYNSGADPITTEVAVGSVTPCPPPRCHQT